MSRITVRYLARCVVVALGYFVAARLGSELAVIGKNVSPLWPATGVALGMLAIFGVRHWPGIFVGAMATPLFTDLPLSSTLLIGLGNSLEPVLAVLLLRRVGFDRSLGRVRDVLWLLLFGAVVGPLASAGIGAVGICLSGLSPWSKAPYVFFIWWVGNAMGAIVVGPLVLLFPSLARTKLWPPNRRTIEALAAAGSLVAIGALVFTGHLQFAGVPFTMEFLVFPVVIWCALRFGPRGAAVAAVTCSAIAVWGTLLEVGPFVRGGMTESIIVMQVFMAAVALTAMLLGAAVAERQRSDEQVRLLAAALQSTQDAVFITDSQLAPGGPKIVYVNEALCRLTGYRREELIGRSPMSIAGDDVEHVRFLPLRESMRTGKPYFGELINYRKDGSSFPAEVQVTPVFAEDGTITHFLSSRRDISERRELQGKLAMAERLASVGTLAAGVAHEINNPLTFISSNLEFLRRELIRSRIVLDRPELQEAVSECIVGADRVREIVGDLKLFSRDTGEVRTPVQLNDVLELALRMSSHELRPRARLVKELGTPPLVEVNEGRVGQVLVNLLVNAAQAIPVGSPEAHEVRVRTGGDLQTGAWVEIDDTGEGIAPDVLPRIFDPFFTTKEVGVGTGLGLTICHQIVKAYGGEITVTSERGKGTAFRVVLPASAAQPVVAEPSAAIRPPNPTRVLVIDDEPRIGQSTRRVLEPDHEVDVCIRAEDALKWLGEGRLYDVVLCDLHMPGMTGMEFHRELESRMPALAERVLFFSGGAFTAASQEFVARMSEVVLEKPVRPELLEQAIADVLASRGRLTRNAAA